MPVAVLVTPAALSSNDVQFYLILVLTVKMIIMTKNVHKGFRRHVKLGKVV